MYEDPGGRPVGHLLSAPPISPMPMPRKAPPSVLRTKRPLSDSVPFYIYPNLFVRVEFLNVICRTKPGSTVAYPPIRDSG